MAAAAASGGGPRGLAAAAPGGRRGARSRSREEAGQPPSAPNVWRVNVPSAYNDAVCATCLGPLQRRTPRARCGGLHARVHHLACIAHRCGPPESLVGWEALSADDQSKARAAMQAGLATQALAAGGSGASAGPSASEAGPDPPNGGPPRRRPARRMSGLKCHGR